MTSSYGVFLGLDVGKGEHHGVGLDPTGKRLHDGPLPNSEPKLRALLDKLAAHGSLLVIVDQPATIGALPVARACGHQMAYLPGLAMRRIADLYPGTAKTDARDAFIIADAAATSCSPCSATAPTTGIPDQTPLLPRRLDNHIGTPPRLSGQSRVSRVGSSQRRR